MESIIIAPIVTEKGYGKVADGQYTFKVHPSANKIEIRKAIETIFKVKVVSVNTMKVSGKTRRLGAKVGRTPSFKKAYVKLAEGQVIEELRV